MTRVWFLGGAGIFLLCHHIQTRYRVHKPPIQWVRETLSLGIKGCEADHSPAFSAVVKYAQIYTFIPPYIKAWCLVKHRNNLLLHHFINKNNHVYLLSNVTFVAWMLLYTSIWVKMWTLHFSGVTNSILHMSVDNTQYAHQQSWQKYPVPEGHTLKSQWKI